MINRYSAVGFEVTDRDSLEALAHKVLNNGRKIPARRGEYRVLEGRGGEEVWLQLNKNGDIVGLNPHFRSALPLTVTLNEDIVRSSDTELDGALHGAASPAEAGPRQLVFDLPDRDRYGPLELPQVMQVSMAAFAHELSVYSDERAFAMSTGHGALLKARTFMPTGLIGESAEPAATAIISGVVTETEELRNTWTGRPYLRIRLRTDGGEIDAVTDPRLLVAVPEADNVCSGSFWLSGRLVGEPRSAAGSRELAKVSWLTKLLGR